MGDPLAHDPTRPTKRRKGIWARRPKPYAAAVSWVRTPEHQREPRGKKSQWETERIAQLPRAWGEKLDALDATHAQMRWVAVTLGHEHVATRLARYGALVKLLEGAPPHERGPRFRALVAAMPTCDGRGNPRQPPAKPAPNLQTAPPIVLRDLEELEDDGDELEDEDDGDEDGDELEELEGAP